MLVFLFCVRVCGSCFVWFSLSIFFRRPPTGVFLFKIHVLLCFLVHEFLLNGLQKMWFSNFSSEFLIQSKLMFAYFQAMSVGTSACESVLVMSHGIFL